MAAANATQTNANSSNPTSEAIDLLCARHLHQSLWLKENDTHDRLRVTFSTTTNFVDTSLPVVLLCPPMLGSRWMVTEFDQLAKSIGVRVVCSDRPGMGGSTPVPLEIRMKVWLETVPVLLETLNVQHVSLLCHSAGTVYGLNTLYYLRDVLDPERPYIGLIGPWVHNDHSGATLMTWASKLPTGMLDPWNKVIQFVNQRVAPVASWSGGVMTAVAGLYQTTSESADSETAALAERYGTDESVAKETEALRSKYFWSEDTTGASEEAKLCLQKVGPESWLVAGDYMNYVQRLVEQERERPQPVSTQSKLRVQVFFAESDIMIGKGGQAYFEKCWNKAQTADLIKYESQELPETNHDTTLVDQKKGALRTIFREISRASRRDA